MRRLDDPTLVEREYASDERLALRSSIYRDLREAGEHFEDVLLRLLADGEPRRVLEVGCGAGALSARIHHEVRANVVSTDLSPHMVERARARGVDARVADVQELPFADDSFDAVVANRMLYHVPDLERGLTEIARVLSPHGRLLATAASRRNLRELFDLAGDDTRYDLSFTAERGEERLRRHFGRVERHLVEGSLVFPDRETAQRFIRSTIRRAHLAERLEPFAGPLRVRTAHAVFVAYEPGR